jgi:hypothetical protein
MSKKGGYRKKELRDAHKLCTCNETVLRASELAGCFYCCKVYPASEIKEWIRENRGERTAVCPKCGIDSVIGSNAAVLSDEFLSAMEEYWFSDLH